MAPNVALPTVTSKLGPPRLLDLLHAPKLEERMSPDSNNPPKEKAPALMFGYGSLIESEGGNWILSGGSEILSAKDNVLA
ncbi:unnamed protein product [Alternaria alternata]